jgi:hypothetical protein
MKIQASRRPLGAARKSRLLLGLLALGVPALGAGCGQDVPRTSRRGAPGARKSTAMAANLNDVGKPSADIAAADLPGPREEEAAQAAFPGRAV